MGKVMNIYGVYIDEETPIGKITKKYRETRPSRSNCQFLENWIRLALENCNEHFYLYVHKTNKRNISSILNTGLEIYEENGYLESTMARAFDSSSSDIEGDINYFLNSVNSANQYGDNSIVAIIPKDYTKAYKLIHSSKKAIVPKKIIIFAIDEKGLIAYGNGHNIYQSKTNNSKVK